IIGFLEHLSSLCERVENESNLISPIIDFDEQPEQLYKNDRWKQVAPRWIESGQLPQLNVVAMRARLNRLRASCSDRSLRKIFDECNQALGRCDQKAMDDLQQRCREVMLTKARMIELAFTKKL
ncbi:MAG: hypothetical protein Q7T55_18215, partial [Solirubrobacteraceae bacterium]|nr:hypothetical protein [Solirubrobacteraceae bacterium]